MYYIWSILITIFLFLILQYNEYKKNINENKKYNILNVSNIIVIIMIYLISTIICYYSINNDSDIFNNIATIKTINDNKNTSVINPTNVINSINPINLKKIPDNINVGFTPYEE